MRYDLRRADTAVKWLVTCLLGTFGLAYLFGGWMVLLYAGLTPARVAATYGGERMSMTMPPEATAVVQHPRCSSEFATQDVHQVGLDLLVQQTHLNVPTYGVSAA